MSFQFSPFGNDQFFDSNGNLAVGYKLFTYLAGTTTKTPVYADIGGTTPHTNPIVLNSVGLPPAPIFLEVAELYKFVFTTPTDTDPPIAPIYTVDDVSVGAAPPVVPAPADPGNPVINAAMEVWQAGTTFPAAPNLQYAADGFQWGSSGAGVVTINRSTNVPSVAQASLLFTHSLEIDVTTTDAPIAVGNFYVLKHKIEGYNWRPFAQRTLTVSFWARSPKIGVHSFAIRNGGADRYYIAEYTVAVADAWEYKTIPIVASPAAGTWNYESGIGAELIWTIAAGTNLNGTVGAWDSGNFFSSANQVNIMDSAANFFRIVGIKMQLGNVATPLQFRPFQDEVELCERYYQKSFPYATTPIQNAGVGSGETLFLSTVAGAVAIYHQVRYSQSLRAAPTLTFFNPGATNAQARNETDGVDCTGTTPSVNTANEFVVAATANAGNAAGERFGVHWTADARL